jgi:hypothetical protein
MINRMDFFNFLKRNFDKEYSKEEIINTFSNSVEEEKEIDNLLSEIEVEYTIAPPSNLLVNCKAGTVYYKWVAS